MKASEHVVGAEVFHRKFGLGNIEEVDEKTFTISFASGTKRISRDHQFVPDNDNDEDHARLERFNRVELDDKAVLTKSGPRWRLAGAVIDGKAGQVFAAENGFEFWHSGGIASVIETPILPSVNPSDWHGQPVPEREWFIEGLVPMRQVTILNGDGGVGKSLLALQLGACSAMSVDTLGMEPLDGRVLYLGAEDEEDEFRRRLDDITKANGKGFSDLFQFRLVPLAECDATLSRPDREGIMQPTNLWLQTVALVHEFRPTLIVLDTAADLFGGDEIKRGQVRQFIAMLRKLAIKVNCAIVLLAHPSVAGMQSGTGSSGSTAWNNSVRSRLYLTKPNGKEDSDPDARLLNTMKTNYGKVGGEIRLRWQEGVFVVDDGKASPASGILNKRAEEVFLDLLSKLNRQGQRLSPNPSVTHAPKVMAAHPDAKGVSKRQLTEAQQRLLDSGAIKIVEEGPPSRLYRRLLLASDICGEAPSN